ncbi:hypothetical protein LZQ00_04120 [Sphingobacterium sp. SRCM116780]|uniref:hypothetical protein n=1 Tax=Sphingobacterium sp. SRCM116780 TaxID=2907623 RepID=UPI001F3C8568|nr:hypothetical protein [Sphingobacterium sp. SRCM116780]UIR57006.1 hypothetical protein LZQ00_04120 [Sphingobacterium sp. SRCM116780]
MTKKTTFIFLTIFAVPIFAFSQKAYNAIYYSGKIPRSTVKFTLADGYSAGCEIKTIDNKTKKISKFSPENGYADNNKKMKFYRYSTSGKTWSDYFIIEGIEEVYDTIPTKFYGEYYYNGTAYKIVLTKL